ncbi:hypothetical protein FE257_007725 [Aspergillus nanangensis]|uniref:Uncharacterized protein n=1 Tax=Aspergillus nanangensis TaxID=2582783 RepID=A0AAD4H010_ASPNN|nr:hypothetical protein FE257_007725 [Aspergillus nanangensis]
MARPNPITPGTSYLNIAAIRNEINVIDGENTSEGHINGICNAILIWVFDANSGYITRPHDPHGPYGRRGGYSDFHTLESNGGQKYSLILLHSMGGNLWGEGPQSMASILAVSKLVRFFRYHDPTKSVRKWRPTEHWSNVKGTRNRPNNSFDLMNNVAEVMRALRWIPHWQHVGVVYQNLGTYHSPTMAGSGKKNKGKTGGKQKNKKGKSQEGPESQNQQSDLSFELQEPAPLDPFQHLEAEAETQHQHTETQPLLDSVPEVPPEPELAPKEPSELEELHTVVEDASAAPETVNLPSPLADINEGQLDLSTHEPKYVEDARGEPNPFCESNWGEVGASDTPFEELQPSDNNLDTQGYAAEPPEQSPVTAPQSPLFATGPASVPLPSPSFSEARLVTASPDSNHHAPEPNSHTTPSNPFFAPTIQSPIYQSFGHRSRPASPASRTGSPITAAIASPTFRPISPATRSHFHPRVSSPFSKPATHIPQALSPPPRGVSPMAAPALPAEVAALPVDEAASSQQVTTPESLPASPLQQPSPAQNAVSPVFQDVSPVQNPPSPSNNPVSPVPNIASPVQKLISPVPKSASPVPKVSSPLARSAYMSPVMSPHATPPGYPPAIPSAPPSRAPSFATAYHSPAMAPTGYMPQYAYYHHPPPNMPTPRGSMEQPNSAASFQALRDLAYANGHGMNTKGTISPPDHDEPIELLQRIQDAIPDINRLLSSYKNTKGKLHARDVEFRHVTTQHEQDLMHKDFYIEALQNQMRKTANESAEESAKLKNIVNELRMELGNLEEKRKDFEERLEDAEKSKEELSMLKNDLEGQITALNASIQEAQDVHEKEMERRRQETEESLATQKQELTDLFEEIRAEDEKVAAEALESMKAGYETEKQQMQESRDALEADYNTKVTELESTQIELEDSREQHAKEAEELRQAHSAEVESLRNSHEEKVADMEQHWAAERTDFEQRLAGKIEECDGWERENKKLEEDNVLKEQQLQRAVEGMRMTIDNLDQDCDRLRKTLHSLGEATDLKSTKGDSFFLDCFSELSRLIVSLSKEHFAYLAIDPPKDILSKLPPELPSFLDNTPASRELRSAYVQHVISKTLTYRIFHPFLFTLGRRYDKADTFFQMLSMDIRRKSVRREAFWRQQTLKAAYTTSDAKQSINVVAAVIVDEVVDHLKHFADPRKLDSLVLGLRKIVKLAAETWRFARVERELVLASLPAPEAHVGANYDWQEYGSPKEGKVSCKQDPSRHVILRTFPRIVREAAHGDFAEDQEKANSCFYSHGGVLYSDSPVVMARLQELAKKSTDALTGGDDILQPERCAIEGSACFGGGPTEGEQGVKA